MNLTHPYFKWDDLFSLWNSTIGIEREALRIDQDGNLAETPHSAEWGTRTQQPYIQTDFAEAQVELITPPVIEPREVLNWLKASHQIVATTNQQHHELLWPFSTPAVIPNPRTEIPVAKLDDPKEREYREYIGEYYGKDVQLLSGIHYNFQINPEVMKRRMPDQDTHIDRHNEVYMHLSRNYYRYRWLLTYLLGVSPYVDPTYGTELYGNPHKSVMRSIRQSRYGYNNKEDVKISYDTLESFVEDLEYAVSSKQLSLQKELYRDVRLRGGKEARDLLTKGIQYVEFRNFDIDPFSPYGMSEAMLKLVKVFIITLLFMEDAKAEGVRLGDERNREIAEEDPFTPLNYLDEAQMLFDAMKKVARGIDEQSGRTGELERVINEYEAMIHDVTLTPAARVVKNAKDSEEFLRFGLKQARLFQEVYLEKPYLLHGFEGFELSTQDVLKEAMRHGIEIDVLDEAENLVRLSYKDQTEIIKNGNMTRLDSLISYFVMEDKVVTKKILSDVGIHVPQGVNFNNLDQALHHYSQLKEEAIVVKPKNTNYGLGITIFHHKPSQKDYEDAIKFAFQQDTDVIIEEFLEGTELRFYIQGGEIKGIVERQPAQVKGDGQSTIHQLIEEENKHSLRGVQHFAPMTYLEKGEAERLQLAQQGYTFDSVPSKDEIVYLRANSNVSTGGMSIDRTEEVHPEFKAIAIKAANALEANFCGIDLILRDWTIPPSEDNPYGIIEANFNPAMWIHRFVGEGTPRYVGYEVLKQLFPHVPFH